MVELVEIIFYALVAVIILVRLRAVLGRVNTIKVVQNIKIDDVAKIVEAGAKDYRHEISDDELKKIVVGKDNNATINLLNEVKKENEHFNIKHFIETAETVYEEIIKSFASENIKALKDLVNKEIYDFFIHKIENRKAAEKKQEVTIISIDNINIYNVEKNEGIVKITLRFLSQQVVLVKDKDDNIIYGDISSSETVEDVWSFVHSFKSSDPRWLVCAIS